MATNDASASSADGQVQQNGQQPAAAPPSSSSSSSPSAEQPPATAAAQRAGLAQALAELARGERAADKLERELHAFEAKLEELLSSMGMTEADLDAIEGVGDDEDGEDNEDDENDKAGEGKKGTTATTPKTKTDSGSSETDGKA